MFPCPELIFHPDCLPIAILSSPLLSDPSVCDPIAIVSSPLLPEAAWNPTKTECSAFVLALPAWAPNAVLKLPVQSLNASFPTAVTSYPPLPFFLASWPIIVLYLGKTSSKAALLPMITLYFAVSE